MWTSSKAQSDFARLVVLFVIPFATKFGRSEEEAKTRLPGFSDLGIWPRKAEDDGAELLYEEVEDDEERVSRGRSYSRSM